jgi:hypothetical protein
MALASLDTLKDVLGVREERGLVVALRLSKSITGTA